MGISREGRLSLHKVERVVSKEEVNCNLWYFLYKERKNFWQEKGGGDGWISKAGQRGVL